MSRAQERDRNYDGQKEFNYHIRRDSAAANRSVAIRLPMPRIAKVILFGLIGTAAIAAATFVYVRGDRLADRLLRAGGRIVLSAAQRPRRVAIAFATAMLLVWLAIGLRCAWESWRERRRIRIQQRQSVAKSVLPG